MYLNWLVPPTGHSGNLRTKEKLLFLALEGEWREGEDRKMAGASHACVRGPPCSALAPASVTAPACAG